MLSEDGDRVTEVAGLLDPVEEEPTARSRLSPNPPPPSSSPAGWWGWACGGGCTSARVAAPESAWPDRVTEREAEYGKRIGFPLTTAAGVRRSERSRTHNRPRRNQSGGNLA